jgi:hypothetical protein
VSPFFSPEPALVVVLSILIGYHFLRQVFTHIGIS